MTRRLHEEDCLPEPEMFETPDWMTLEEGLDAIGGDRMRPVHSMEIEG